MHLAPCLRQLQGSSFTEPRDWKEDLKRLLAWNNVLCLRKQDVSRIKVERFKVTIPHTEGAFQRTQLVKRNNCMVFMKQLFIVCYDLDVPLRVHVLKTKHQCNCVGMQDFQEVIRTLGLFNGLIAFSWKWVFNKSLNPASSFLLDRGKVSHSKDLRSTMTM